MSNQQRKLVYLGCIVGLFVPIMLLGFPAGRQSGDEEAGFVQTGGYLSQLRTRYDLGETTLGKVDPAGTSMTFALLQFRGLAANQQWLRAQEFQKTKDWGRMRSTIESITMLQPHYRTVWRYQGWNLSYNVSAEWDRVPDRYYWVKEGMKFLNKGQERNDKIPDLKWDIGWLYGFKIGRSDEWQFYRAFFNPEGYDDRDEYFRFRGDPDKDTWKGGPDGDVNPQGQDNYLVAKEWFFRANATEEKYPYLRGIQARELFRSWPARSQFDYAGTLQREGKFSEAGRQAWEKAYSDWTAQYQPSGLPGYGQELFLARDAGYIKQEVTSEDDLRQLQGYDRERGLPEIDVALKKSAIGSLQNMTHYRFWKQRARIERDNKMFQSRVKLNDGKNFFKEGKFFAAEREFKPGMQALQDLIIKHPELTDDTDVIELALMAVLMYRKMHDEKWLGRPLPADYPLRRVWESHQQAVPDVKRLLSRELSQSF